MPFRRLSRVAVGSRNRVLDWVDSMYESAAILEIVRPVKIGESLLRRTQQKCHSILNNCTICDAAFNSSEFFDHLLLLLLLLLYTTDNKSALASTADRCDTDRWRPNHSGAVLSWSRHLHCQTNGVAVLRCSPLIDQPSAADSHVPDALVVATRLRRCSNGRHSA